MKQGESMFSIDNVFPNIFNPQLMALVDALLKGAKS